MKKSAFLIVVLILFLPSFLIGFFFRKGESFEIKENQPNELAELDELIGDHANDKKDEEKDRLDSKDGNVSEKDDDNPMELVDESTLNAIEKTMEDPKVIDALVSVASDLEDVQVDLEDENEKEIVKLVQKSLQEYISEDGSYKETVSEALTAYNKLNAEQKNRIVQSIMSNVSWKEMLFLKEAFNS